MNPRRTVALVTSGRPIDGRASAALQFEKLRKVAELQLGQLSGLFRVLTGRGIHVVWGPCWPGRWKPQDPPTGSSVCRAARIRHGWFSKCTKCLEQHFRPATKAGADGDTFECSLGVRNFWMPIVVRGRVLGLAFIQEQEQAGYAMTEGTRPDPFARAATLLRLILYAVQVSAEAGLLKQELEQARRAVLEFKTVAARKQASRAGFGQSATTCGPVLETESHADRLAHLAMDYINVRYHRPLTLGECAAELRLSPAYVSVQFSRAVGMSFKAYLTALRIDKATELLSEPTRTIAEVAGEVGYASENRFRIAFKKATGLPPRIWRETLRINRDGKEKPATTS